MNSYITNAIYLAWTDVLSRYKKSILGPFWFTLGNLVGILGLGIVWGSLLKENLDTFLPSLASGLIVWQFISGSLIESCTIFTSHGQIIRNVKMPAWFFTSRLLARQSINLLHNLFILVGILLYFHKGFSSTMALSLIGLLLLILNIGWLIYIIGILATRFRDIEYTLTSFMPILFFITPVIFRPDHIPSAIKSIATFNPLAYLIEIVRSPILGKVPDINSYSISFLMIFIGYSLAYWVSQKHIKRLPYWV